MKNLKKLLLVAVACLFTFSGCNLKKEQTVTVAGSTVNRFKINDVVIHNYVSPANSVYVTSQIIETKNQLVLVDAQFLRPYAKDLKAYIESLNKPLERIIISHGHPDHWFGLEFFKGVPVYALKEVRNEIKKYGDYIIKAKKAALKDLVTDKKVVPTKIVKEGKETIDGLEYIFTKYVDSESSAHLLIELPEVKTMVAQDLVYNKVHLFTGQNEFDGWIKSLNRLKKKKEYKLILAGHGEPADYKVYDEMIAYLQDSKKFFKEAKNGAELKEKLLKKYKDYRSPLLLDISNDFLYK